MKFETLKFFCKKSTIRRICMKIFYLSAIVYYLPSICILAYLLLNNIAISGVLLHNLHSRPNSICMQFRSHWKCISIRLRCISNAEFHCIKLIKSTSAQKYFLYFMMIRSQTNQWFHLWYQATENWRWSHFDPFSIRPVILSTDHNIPWRVCTVKSSGKSTKHKRETWELQDISFTTQFQIVSKDWQSWKVAVIMLFICCNFPLKYHCVSKEIHLSTNT